MMLTKFALHPFDISEMKTVQKLRGAGIYCAINLLDAKMRIRLKKILKFQNGEKMDCGEIICSRTEGRKFCRR